MLQTLCLLLFLVALILIQFLIGGTRLVFSLPSYGILGLLAIISPWLYRKSNIPPYTYALVSAALLAAYLILRALFSPIDYLARTDLLLVLASGAVYFLVALHFAAPKKRWFIVLICLGLLILNGFWGLFQYLHLGKVTIFSFLNPSDYGWRATGLFICPNHLAGFLEMAILMGLALLVWSRRSIWTKLATAYAMILGVIALILTGSRGGYLSLGVGLSAFVVMGLMALYRQRHRRFGWALRSTLLIVVLGGVALGWFLSKNMTLQTRTAGLNNSGQVRIDLWQAAWQTYKQSPVIGTGSGTYYYFGRQFRSPSLQADPEHVHNDYLELLTEYGVVGLLLMLGFLGLHFWHGWRTFRWFTGQRGERIGRLASDAAALHMGAFCSFIALGFHSLIDFNLHIPSNTLLMALCLGILANPGVVLPFRETNNSEALRQARWWLPAIGLWLVLAAIFFLPGEYYAERSRLAYRESAYAEALAFAEKGLAKESGNPFLYLYFGQTLLELHPQISEEDMETGMDTLKFAVETFQEGLRLFPQDKWLLLGTAEALTLLGEGQLALQYFERALHQDPNSASTRALYARHLHFLGRWDEAMEAYQKSDQLFPNDMARNGMVALQQDRARAAQP